MIRDVTDLLVYTIKDAVERRPDLILMYYPSKYGFYWLVARVVSLLERIDLKDEDLIYAHSELAVAVR